MDSYYDANQMGSNYYNAQFNQSTPEAAAAMAAVAATSFYLNHNRHNNSASLMNEYQENSFNIPNASSSLLSKRLNSPNILGDSQKLLPYIALTSPLSTSSNLSSTPSSCSSISSMNSTGEYMKRFNYNTQFQYTPTHSDHHNTYTYPNDSRTLQYKSQSCLKTEEKDNMNLSASSSSFVPSTPSNVSELSPFHMYNNNSSNSEVESKSSSNNSIISNESSKASYLNDSSKFAYKKPSTSFITPSLMHIEGF